MVSIYQAVTQSWFRLGNEVFALMNSVLKFLPMPELLVLDWLDKLLEILKFGFRDGVADICNMTQEKVCVIDYRHICYVTNKDITTFVHKGNTGHGLRELNFFYQLFFLIENSHHTVQTTTAVNLQVRVIV
jgi:hypothetical protein